MSRKKTRYKSSSAISVSCSGKQKTCRWFSIFSNKTLFGKWTDRRTNNNLMVKIKQLMVVISLLRQKPPMMIQMVDRPNTTPVGQDRPKNFDLQRFALTSTLFKDLPFLYEIKERGGRSF